MLLTAFGFLALLVAAIGVYGVISYRVTAAASTAAALPAWRAARTSPMVALRSE